MDPRSARTQAALRTAVLDLAADRPIHEITAQELAAAAGISRRTLYNHASDPADVLVAVLLEDIGALAVRFFDHFRSDPNRPPVREAAWESGERELAEHLERFSAVYRSGLAEQNWHLSPPLARMLQDSFEEGMSLVLQDSTQTEAERAIARRFIAHGLVGAIEAWLIQPDRSPESFASSVLSLLPHWLPGRGTPSGPDA